MPTEKDLLDWVGKVKHLSKLTQQTHHLLRRRYEATKVQSACSTV